MQNSKLQEVISYKIRQLRIKTLFRDCKAKRGELSLAQKDFDRANKLFKSKVFH